MADIAGKTGTDNASSQPAQSQPKGGGSARGSWLDLSDESIPVIDATGKKVVLKGADFVALAPMPIPVLSPATSSPEPQTKLAPPPPNLPVLDEVSRSASKLIAAQPSTTLADLGLDMASDIAEIKKIEEKPVVKSVDASQKKELPLLESVVEEAVTGGGVTFVNDDMKRRYRLLVSLFFRDLRDGLETKSKFTMPVQSGGMGFDDATADRVIDDLSSRNAAYHQMLSGRAADDKSQYVAQRVETVLNLQENTDRHEQERGDKAFDGLMKRVGVRAEEPPAKAPVVQSRSIPVVGLDSAPKANAPVAAVPVTGLPQAARMPQFGDSRMPQTGARPVVSDVAYAPRLTGPVDEIRLLTLKDFRRLSRDPKEATLKIKDKLDLLEEQSFAVKTLGIDAWHGCEVNRMYLDILRQSLNGKPVVEVIAELEKKSAQTLTKDEFDAVMQLNQKLRFG